MHRHEVERGFPRTRSIKSGGTLQRPGGHYPIAAVPCFTNTKTPKRPRALPARAAWTSLSVADYALEQNKPSGDTFPEDSIVYLSDTPLYRMFSIMVTTLSSVKSRRCGGRPAILA